MTNNQNGNYVGIDLGTTQSVVAYLDRTGTPNTITNSEGDALTPSAVYFDGVNAVVGKSAKKASSHFPDKVATIIKRDMGQPIYARVINGRHFRPETLSAILLRKLKQDAERRIGPIAGAVVTVPAFFDDTRRKATEDAGTIAGLKVLDIINEPTAAAIGYSLQDSLLDRAVPAKARGQKTILVYDLGGGTFDVTIVRYTSNHFTALATGGAVQLGGRDWDDRIVDYIGQVFGQQHGFSPLSETKSNESHHARDSLANHAESTKELLSQLPMAPLEFTYQGKQLNATITREQFESKTRDLLAHTRVLTDHVREEAKLSWQQIDRILLVGGSTRMPMIKGMIRELSGADADDSLDPDQVVARGGAIYAAILATDSQQRLRDEVDAHLVKRLRGIEVRNINSHNLGIEVHNRKTRQQIHYVLIPKNSPLPSAKSKVFKMGKNGETQLTVNVLEGDAKEASSCIRIGKCIISELPPNLSADSPIQVQLRCEQNGRVTVTALEPSQGVAAKTEIRREGGLTEDDIRRESEFVQNLNIQ